MSLPKLPQEEQKEYTDKIDAMAMACPWDACWDGEKSRKTNAIDAQFKAVELGKGNHKYPYAHYCPHCSQKLEKVIPFVAFPPWYWIRGTEKDT